MKEWQVVALSLGGVFSVVGLIIFLATLAPSPEERISKITEPQHIATCYNSALGEGLVVIEVKSWRTWNSGFTLYYMDGTHQFFSSGNSCVVEKIERTNIEDIGF